MDWTVILESDHQSSVQILLEMFLRWHFILRGSREPWPPFGSPPPNPQAQAMLIILIFFVWRAHHPYMGNPKQSIFALHNLFCTCVCYNNNKTSVMWQSKMEVLQTVSGRLFFFFFAQILLVLCLHLEGSEAAGEFRQGRRWDGMLGGPGGEWKGDLLPEQWFTQTLDHFNPADTRTWKQVSVLEAFYGAMRGDWGTRFLILCQRAEHSIFFCPQNRPHIPVYIIWAVQKCCLV